MAIGFVHVNGTDYEINGEVDEVGPSVLTELEDRLRSGAERHPAPVSVVVRRGAGRMTLHLDPERVWAFGTWTAPAPVVPLG